MQRTGITPPPWSQHSNEEPTTGALRSPLSRWGRGLGGGVLLLAYLLAAGSAAADKTAPPSPYFGIHLVDDRTGRGVPLVTLQTVNDIVLVSDSAGWVAFREPDLMNREVYFAISGPGIEYPRDGFGFRGVRLTTTPGKTATVKVRRTSIAERLYRVTGQGIYRDSLLLGLPVPSDRGKAAVVLGQDSVQAVPYRGRIFWLWGDTNEARYPLGNYSTTAATSPLPGKGKIKPAEGVELSYFMNEKEPQRVRRMVPLAEPGAVWLFGLLTVPDKDGKETLLAHYSRQKSLGETLEQGLVRFNDKKGLFEKLVQFDLKNTWQHPRNNAFRVREDDTDYYYFAAPFAYTRVRASEAPIKDPDHYEALTFDPDSGKYLWQRKSRPTTQADEQKLLKSGQMKPGQARYALIDEHKQPVRLHTASINYNNYRKQWILIGLQQGDRAAPSFLGELWYAEAETPTGPWRQAVKIATHPRYSFYNPRQHTFFDEAGGRVIYFEGTYTRTFSGNPVATPRYEYNQILYRLDLSDERLKRAQ